MIPARARVIARNVLHNVRTGVRHALARTGGFSGALEGTDAAARAEHIRRVFAHYTGNAPEPLPPGAQVLELGPGDSLGVAALLAQAGAARVVAVDKFRYDYGSATARATLETLGVERLSRERVMVLCGASLESTDLGPYAPFDWIVSNAVLEELAAPERTLAAMNRLLRPGGWLLNQIDLSDYGIFSGRGFSPWEFLTVADPMWRAMTCWCGSPNRRGLGFYRDVLAAMGYRVAVRVTHRYGAAEAPALIERIRPRMLPRYRALPAEELAVSGIFLAARKPEAKEGL